ncbi:MAG TPA: CvpA family protein [Nitrospiria bacterium]|nr:CvpA family protein [Nitrospiria bacterium]
MSLNVFDIVFIVLLLAFTLFSYLRGATRELMTLVGLAGGFLAANWYAVPLAGEMSPFLPEGNAAELLAFVLIMVGGYFIGVFLGGFGDTFRRQPEGDVSRLLACVIGLFKGIVVSLALFWVVQTYLPSFQDEMAESWFGGRLNRLVTMLRSAELI